MFIAPAQCAEWIRSRLLRISLEEGDLSDRERPTIGLKMRFKEIVPEVLLNDLRFDLLVEVPEVVPETGNMRIGYRRPNFVVTDAMTICSSEPSCLLKLSPAPRLRVTDECHRTMLLVLADEASQYMRRNGTQRDWRNQVARVVFYHSLHREKRKRSVKNPDYEPMPVVHVSTVWDAIPKALQTEDQGSLEDYLARIDEAFGESGGNELLTADHGILPKTGS